MDQFTSYMMTFSKFIMILLSAVIMVRCIRSMLREKYEPETWAYLRVGRETLPVRHWENLIGRFPLSGYPAGSGKNQPCPRRLEPQ